MNKLPSSVNFFEQNLLIDLIKRYFGISNSISCIKWIDQPPKTEQSQKNNIIHLPENNDKSSINK